MTTSQSPVAPLMSFDRSAMAAALSPISAAGKGVGAQGDAAYGQSLS